MGIDAGDRTPSAWLWICRALLAAWLFALAGFPAPALAQDGCAWFGSRPFCNGECPSDTVYTGQRQACLTGSRRYCCPARMTRVRPGSTNCGWAGTPGSMIFVCDDPQAVPQAAVAIDGRGAWGASIKPWSFNASDTAARARNDARTRCGAGCKVVDSGPGRCVALFESRSSGYWVGFAHGTDRNFVLNGARKGCTDRAPQGSCRLLHVNCL